VVIEGWRSSPETKHLDDVVNQLGEAAFTIHDLTETRMLGLAVDLLREIVRGSYSPVPLFTNMMSKELMAFFLKENEGKMNITQLENALATFLFGNATLYFLSHLLEATTYLLEFVTLGAKVLLGLDESKLAEISNRSLKSASLKSAPVVGTRTEEMRKLIEVQPIWEVNRKSLMDLIDKIEKAIANPRITETGDKPSSTAGR
jgi:hypothetical protein